MSGPRLPVALLPLLAAVQFLTRLPVSLPEELPDGRDHASLLAASTVWFPVVGGLVGMLAAAVLVAAAWVWPPLLAAALVLAAETLLTGAFHDDAWADTCDAIGGGWTREQVLTILKDSRLGTYGVAGLTLGLGLRAAALAELIGRDVAAAAAVLVAAHAGSRLAILGLMRTMEPIRDRHTQARDVAGQLSGTRVVGASLLALPWLLPAAVSQPGRMAAAAGVTTAVLWLYRRKIIARVGGSTGDFLGGGAFLTHTLVLVVAAA